MIDDYNRQDTVISSLPISPPLLSVCGNLFSSFVEHVQLKLGRNKEWVGWWEMVLFVLQEVISCVLVSSAETFPQCCKWTCQPKPYLGWAWVGGGLQVFPWTRSHNSFTKKRSRWRAVFHGKRAFVEWAAAALASSFGSICLMLQHTHFTNLCTQVALDLVLCFCYQLLS